MTQCHMALRSQTQLSHGVWFCGCCRHAACGVAGAVVTALCRGRGHHATCGVTVAVVAPCSAIVAVTVIAPCVAVAVATPCVVSWVLSSGCIMSWSRSPCRVQCPDHCCRAGLHAARGATGTVATPCVVPQVQSLCCTWCRRCCRRSACGVAGALLSCRAWCRRCCRRATRGVVGTVVRPRGRGGHATCGVITIVVACEVVIGCGHCATCCRGRSRTPRVVSRSRSSCCMVL